MPVPDEIPLSDLFADLVELPLAEREQFLAGLPPGQRAALEELLAADAADGDPLGSALEAAALLRDEPAERRLGPWRILRELGAGGMGTVLLAERDDRQYRQQVAIKLIRGFPTQEGMRRLRQERQILAGLDHPYIARLIDGGETADGQPYVVMEFVEGEGLLRHVGARAPSLAERLALFDRVAEAVEYAHRNLVVHRDLKPANVLVRADGTPKLLDFGVAKLIDLDAASVPEQTLTVAYSAGYASPEQIAGRPVTTLSDIYSLGVLLRAMLTGAVAGADAAPDFPRLAADTELRGLIAMATAEDPGARYASVDALREDLRRYRESRPLRAAPDTALYRARKFVRRNRWQSAAAAVVALTAVAFVWRLGVERDRALDAEARALERGAAAERAATSARRTLDYVVTIFGRAHPDRVLGRELTPRRLIDEAAQELESRLAGEPAARRTLQSALGQIYGALGAPREALGLLGAAIAGFTPQSREDALWSADTLAALAAAAQAADDYATAADAVARAATLREQWAAEDPLQRLYALGERGRAALYAGNTAEAKQRWSEAIALARARPGVPPELVDELLLSLSGVAEQTSSLELGDAVTAELVARLEARLPPNHPALLPALRQRAGVLGYLGRIEESEALFRRVIALHEAVLGKDGERLSHIENDFGVMLAGAARFRDAVPHLERAAALLAAALGGEDYVDGVTLVNLGSAQEGMGDYVASLATVERALSRFRARRAPDNAELLRATGNYARNLAFVGRFDEARALMQDTIARMRAAEGEDSAWATFNEFRLAQIERLAGRPEDAARLLEEAAPRFQQIFPPGHPSLAQLHRLRGRLALERGDAALAARELAQARKLLVEGGALPIDIAMLEVSEAALAESTGDTQTARTVLARALQVLRGELLPAEVTRAEGERLAQRIGLPPPAMPEA